MASDTEKYSIEGRAPATPGVNEVLLRITGACNQRCKFCNTDNMKFHMSVRDVFRRCYGLDRESVTPILTGGEPTVHGECMTIIHLLGEMGFRRFGIQTNAMRFEDRGMAADAAAAGLGFAIVSLHSPSAETSDLITDCPGGFERTLKGIRNLAGCGVEIIINHVLNALNFRMVVDFVNFIHAEVYDGPNARGAPGVFNLSVVQPSGKAQDNRDIVPRLAEAAPFYVSALKRCGELGIYAVNPGCGMPVCFTPGFEDRSSELFLIENNAAQVRTISANKPLKVKGARCGSCLYDSRCLGVWRNYADMFGLEELTPVEKPPTGRGGPTFL